MIHKKVTTVRHAVTIKKTELIDILNGTRQPISQAIPWKAAIALHMDGDDVELTWADQTTEQLP